MCTVSTTYAKFPETMHKVCRLYSGKHVCAKHGGRRRPMCDPEGCATVLGAVGGGGGDKGTGGIPPPLVDPNLGGRRVGRSAAGLLGGGGSVGTPTYIPQNDPHDTLIILNMHKWGKTNFKKNLPINSGSHQPRSDGQGQNPFLCFSAIFEFSTKF